MAFAEIEQVEARLGRELSSGEETTVTYLLEAATAVIASHLGRDDEWAAAYDPIAVVQHVTVEMVCRSMSNPSGLESLSETLGQFNYRADFGTAAKAGIDLTKTEELLVRRAVYGQISASPLNDSVLDDITQAVGTYPYDS